MARGRSGSPQAGGSVTAALQSCNSAVTRRAAGNPGGAAPFRQPALAAESTAFTLAVATSASMPTP